MRMVKPEFWTDGKVVRVSREARLLFIGTWNFADCDAGHLEEDALSLKMKIFPADNLDVEPLLDELVRIGLLERFEFEGLSYLNIPGLRAHQRTDSRWVPRCRVCQANRDTKTSPEPAESREDSPDLTETHASSPELTEPHASRGGKGEERWGEERRGEVRWGELSSPESPSDPEREDVTALLDLLDREVQANGNRPSKRNKANTDAMRLLLDRDGNSQEQIAYVIRWVQADSFWKANVRSASKLREKFDDLVARIRSEHERRNRPSEKEQRNNQILLDFMNGPESAEEIYAEGISA
jgi:hypothetical protein